MSSQVYDRKTIHRGINFSDTTAHKMNYNYIPGITLALRNSLSTKFPLFSVIRVKDATPVNSLQQKMQETGVPGDDWNTIPFSETTPQYLGSYASTILAEAAAVFPLVEGTTYFNTTDEELKVLTATGTPNVWSDAMPSPLYMGSFANDAAAEAAAVHTLRVGDTYYNTTDLELKILTVLGTPNIWTDCMPTPAYLGSYANDAAAEAAAAIGPGLTVGSAYWNLTWGKTRYCIALGAPNTWVNTSNDHLGAFATDLLADAQALLENAQIGSSYFNTTMGHVRIMTGVGAWRNVSIGYLGAFATDLLADAEVTAQGALVGSYYFNTTLVQMRFLNAVGPSAFVNAGPSYIGAFATDLLADAEVTNQNATLGSTYWNTALNALRVLGVIGAPNTWYNPGPCYIGAFATDLLADVEQLAQGAVLGSTYFNTTLNSIRVLNTIGAPNVWLNCGPSFIGAFATDLLADVEQLAQGAVLGSTYFNTTLNALRVLNTIGAPNVWYHCGPVYLGAFATDVLADAAQVAQNGVVGSVYFNTTLNALRVLQVIGAPGTWVHCGPAYLGAFATDVLADAAQLAQGGVVGSTYWNTTLNCVRILRVIGAPGTWQNCGPTFVGGFATDLLADAEVTAQGAVVGSTYFNTAWNKLRVMTVAGAPNTWANVIGASYIGEHANDAAADVQAALEGAVLGMTYWETGVGLQCLTGMGPNVWTAI